MSGHLNRVFFLSLLLAVMMSSTVAGQSADVSGEERERVGAAYRSAYRFPSSAPK